MHFLEQTKPITQKDLWIKLKALFHKLDQSFMISFLVIGGKVDFLCLMVIKLSEYKTLIFRQSGNETFIE